MAQFVDSMSVQPLLMQVQLLLWRTITLLKSCWFITIWKLILKHAVKEIQCCYFVCFVAVYWSLATEYSVRQHWQLLLIFIVKITQAITWNLQHSILEAYLDTAFTANLCRISNCLQPCMIICDWIPCGEWKCRFWKTTHCITSHISET